MLPEMRISVARAVMARAHAAADESRRRAGQAATQAPVIDVDPKRELRHPISASLRGVG